MLPELGRHQVISELEATIILLKPGQLRLRRVRPCRAQKVVEGDVLFVRIGKVILDGNRMAIGLQ